MTPKEKAEELVWTFGKCVNDLNMTYEQAKQCALIAVENEYHSLREMLFNLRSCHVIESENVYLNRLQELIDEEKQVKNEIELL